jgi:hypothetical protein
MSKRKSIILTEINKIVKEAKKLPYYPLLDPWRATNKQTGNLELISSPSMKKRD